MLLVVAAALGALLVGCDLLGGVSIDQRVTNLETSLNGDRVDFYTNFNESVTSDYNALKDPSSTIDILMPKLGTGDTPYTLSVTDETDPASGVIVRVTGGPASYGAPKNLKLVMESTGFPDDYLVNSLAMDNNDSNYTVWYN